MRAFATPRNHRAGLDLLGSQQPHDVCNFPRIELGEQGDTRHHAPGNDEIAPMDFIGEGRRDDTDRQRDDNQTRDDRNGSNELAEVLSGQRCSAT